MIVANTKAVSRKAILKGNCCSKDELAPDFLNMAFLIKAPKNRVDAATIKKSYGGYTNRKMIKLT